MQKKDRNRFDLLARENVGKRMQLGFVQRFANTAVGIKALCHLVTMLARHQRQVLLEEQIVGVGPIDPSDFVDVAKSARRHQRRFGAGALQHRVDRDRRAVQKKASFRECGAGLGDAGFDALHHGPRGGQALAEKKPLICLIERRNIRESTPDIGGKAQTGEIGLWRVTRHLAAALPNVPRARLCWPTGLLMVRADCRTIAPRFSLANYLSYSKRSFYARPAEGHPIRRAWS